MDKNKIESLLPKLLFAYCGINFIGSIITTIASNSNGTSSPMYNTIGILLPIILGIAIIKRNEKLPLVYFAIEALYLVIINIINGVKAHQPLIVVTNLLDVLISVLWIAVITIAFIGLIKWFKNDSTDNDSNYNFEIEDTIASHLL